MYRADDGIYKRGSQTETNIDGWLRFSKLRMRGILGEISACGLGEYTGRPPVAGEIRIAGLQGHLGDAVME